MVVGHHNSSLSGKFSSECRRASTTSSSSFYSHSNHLLFLLLIPYNVDDLYSRWFSKHKDIHVTLTPFNVRSERKLPFKEEVDSFHLFVFTGSRCSVFDGITLY